MGSCLELGVRHEFDLEPHTGEALTKTLKHFGAALGDLGRNSCALDRHLGEHGVEYVEECGRSRAIGQVDALAADRNRQASVGHHDLVGVAGFRDHP